MRIGHQCAATREARRRESDIDRLCTSDWRNRESQRYRSADRDGSGYWYC